MQQQNKLFTISYSFGELLLNFLKLHFFWLYFTFRGGIILGIFPAISTVIQAFLYLFIHKEFPNELFHWFKKNYQHNFRPINQLGFIQTFLLGILWLDLRVSEKFIQIKLIHFGLIVLFSIALLVSLYLFPTFLRYDLKLTQYFKQAFFLVISSLFETVAIIIGVFVAISITVFLPILVLLAFIPVILFPLSWFAFQAMQKIERNNQTETSEEA